MISVAERHMALCVPASMSSLNKTRQCVTHKGGKKIPAQLRHGFLSLKMTFSVTNCRVHGVQRPNALQGELTVRSSADYLRAIPQ